MPDKIQSQLCFCISTERSTSLRKFCTLSRGRIVIDNSIIISSHQSMENPNHPSSSISHISILRQENAIHSNKSQYECASTQWKIVFSLSPSPIYRLKIRPKRKRFPMSASLLLLSDPENLTQRFETVTIIDLYHASALKMRFMALIFRYSCCALPHVVITSIYACCFRDKALTRDQLA